MPHKLVALLIIFGTITLMVAWIPCVECTTRFCQHIFNLLGRDAPAKPALHLGKRTASSARKAA